MFFKKIRKRASVDDSSATEGCTLLSLKPKKRKNEIAVVACGCFWNPQARFQKVKGVVRVVVGYTGGDAPDPDYFDIKDHTEALFIEFNPKLVSYVEILQLWHNNDYPWEPEVLRERSAVFYVTDSQHDEALSFLRKLSSSRPNCYLYVDLEPIKTFYQAEDYQQNYVAKQCRAAREKMIQWANNEAQSGLYTILE